MAAKDPGNSGSGKGSNGKSLIDDPLEFNLWKIDNLWNYPIKQNMNGNCAFSPDAVAKYRSIIQSLKHQPDLVPTERGSIQLRYAKDDFSLLFIEVSENSTEITIVPKLNSANLNSKLKVRKITENEEEEIVRCVESFFEEK